MLRLDHINYQIKQFHILKDISCQISTHTGIVGKSGSGKSTLAKILCKLINPTSGSLFYKDRDITKKSINQTYKNIQYVFQLNVDCFDSRYTMRQTFDEISNDYLDILKIVLLDESLLDKYPSELSGGQIQRFILARALLFHPDILILDEVTSALDTIIQKEIIDLLQEIKKETTLIVISHDIALVQKLCDECIVLHEGTIIEQDTMLNIINNPKNKHTKQLIESIV